MLVDWVHEVVQRLGEDFERRPSDTLRTLELLIKLAAASPFELYGIRDEAVKIVTRGYQSPDHGVAVHTGRIVDLLLRSGFEEFRQSRPRS